MIFWILQGRMNESISPGDFLLNGVWRHLYVYIHSLVRVSKFYRIIHDKFFTEHRTSPSGSSVGELLQEYFHKFSSFRRR
jgi:hypothetical protein